MAKQNSRNKKNFKAQKNDFFEKKKIINLSIFFIIVLTIVAFSPTFSNGFLLMDDPFQVTENADITSLSLINLRHIFSSYYVFMYTPLATFSYAVIFKLFGLNACAYHSFSLILHLINIFLVYKLVAKFTQRNEIIIFVTLLFAINPLQTEAVAWVSAASTLLSNMFFLLSLIIYMSFIQNKNRAKNYYLSFLFFILALFSKSSAVTLPLIFLLCDYFIKAKISKKDLLNKIPFFILSIIFGIITLKGRVDTTNVANIIQTYGMFDRIIFIIYSLTFYILNVLLPLTMSKYHPYPETEGGMLPIVYYVMPFILGGIIFLIIKVKRCKREIIFGSLFFLISISVMIELIPVGISIVKQRYNYLSCVGLYFAFFTFLFTYFDKNHRVKTFISVGLVLLSISFVALSFGRAQTWKNSISLWNDAIKKYPRCYLAYEDRAVYYSNTGSIDNAIDDFTKAIEIKIDFSDAYYNRGNAYMKKGLNDKAIEDFSNAIKYAPDYAKAYNNRGYIYDNHRYYDKAVADYSKALQIDSAFPKAYNNLEMVYLKQGLYDRVISDYTKTIKSNPNDTAAYCNRGMAFMNKKLYDQAIEDFTKVIILKPDFVDAFYNRGIVYNDQSLFDKAVEDFTKAIVLKPDYATAFNSRAFAYLGKNSRDKACEDFEKAIELGSVEAKNNLMKYCK